ncbi:perlucin-like protein [Amphiura filiformis]|uniref:perlucin-like protein n=1 Tax=Amphiura filiformis TaxID=82378 RepID=UPI003B224C4D
MDAITSTLSIPIIFVYFLVSQAQVYGSCPPEWLPHEENCYFISTDRLTFHAAQTSCQSMGAELTSVHSAAENTFLLHEMQASGIQGMWIGLHDTSSEGNFQWTDGTPFDYFDWKENEPNNFADEDCVHLWRYETDLVRQSRVKQYATLIVIYKDYVIL